MTMTTPMRTVLALALLAATGCSQVGSPLASALGGDMARAQATKPVGPGIDDLFTSLTAGKSPGAAVVVLDGGKVIHKKGYGLADMGTKRPVANDTVFDLGGTSKSLTALAVMALADKRLLALDDKVAKYLPQFTGDAAAISVRHLLNQTAGLKDYKALYQGQIDQGVWKPGFEPTAKDIVALLAKQPELNFTPGSAFENSDSAYVVLAQVVAKAAGRPFPEVMKQVVFKPLGMTSAQVYDESKPADPKRAKSYTFRNGAYENVDYSPLNLVYGDRNVNASLDDMAGFGRAFTPGIVASAATLKAATKPPTLDGGDKSHYGFGLLVKEYAPGVDMLMHAGLWVGFRSAFIAMPKRGFTAVILSNTKETAALALADEIMQQVVTGRKRQTLVL